MASLQSSSTHVNQMLAFNPLPNQVTGGIMQHRRRISHRFRAQQNYHTCGSEVSQVKPLRRELVGVGIVAPWIPLLGNPCSSSAAESKKGFIPVMDKKDGYEFLYPFGWQEVVIEGQDKVYKDVIEPLESVSVNLIATSKQTIRDFGTPQEVAETLIRKVLVPPSQKSKLVGVSEHDVNGTTYYTFEFVAKAPNFTRHALSAITIGNGKFYTLTTGANERRWEKMKDRLQTVVESFKIFAV